MTDVPTNVAAQTMLVHGAMWPTSKGLLSWLPTEPT